MSIQPSNVVIDNKKFQIIPFTAKKAMNIERKLMSILIPVVTPLLSGKGELNLDKNIDLSGLGEGFKNGLGNLSDESFEILVSESLSNTTYIPNGKAPVTLDSDEGFNLAFTGSLLTCYKLIWEVMKVNRFCFLELMGGLGMNITGSSKEAIKE